MSAPLLWIGFPLIIAAVLWFISRRTLPAIFIATGVSLALAILAWLLPIEQSVTWGGLTIDLGSALVIFGRRFVLSNGDRPVLILMYIFGTCWFLGARVARAHRYFLPIGLGMIALLIAALAVEPFLYAALLVETSVLISIPMLVPPGQRAGQGVLRFLIFQSLAVPFVLLAGWTSAVYEANPVDTRFLSLAILFLGLGFSFWLAVFPFYSWVPLLSEETDSYAAGFLLSLFPMVGLLLLLDFLNAFTWLRAYPNLTTVLQGIGVLMVITGGVWAAFQQNLTRLFGYAVIIESGFALLALSLRNQAGLEIFAAALLPRAVGLGLWAMALTQLKQHVTPDFEGVRGLLRRFPLISIGVAVGSLSIVGMPLLAGFSMRVILLDQLGLRSLSLVLWCLLGSAGLLLGGLRALAAMARSDSQSWAVEENWQQAIFLVGGTLIVILIGILPRWFLTDVLSILLAFPRLP